MMKYKAIFMVILISAVSPALADAQPGSSPILEGPYLGQEPPGDTPVLFSPGVISTGKEHSAAMFTPDGNEVWFGRLFPAAIYFMSRTDGKWTEPQLAPFCDTSTTSLYPVLSHEGTQVFFSSDRPLNPQAQKLPRGDYHLWVSEKTAGQWSDPQHLDDSINLGRRQSCGYVAANGDLYFASFVQDRSLDIFYSKSIGDGYGNPESLSAVNSPTPDHSPFVAPDRSYLIFSSFRGGLGRSDLFISFRDQNGHWSKPENMGSTINSEFKDEYPYVTPDGNYLFFNSNRPSSLNKEVIGDGPGNIYWVDAGIIERLKLKSGGAR